jgi:hypothetical protein
MARCVSSQDKILNDFPSNKMFLDDPFQYIGRATVIPNRLGIDNRNRAILADTEAISLGSIDKRCLSRYLQFFEPSFKELPRFKSNCLLGTIWFGLICAEENVATVIPQSEILRRLTERVSRR